MSEFKEKVEQYKQTIIDPGFKTDNGDVSGITESPTIGTGDAVDDGVPQEAHQNDDQHSDEQPKHKKPSRKTVEGLKKRIDQITYERNVREAQAKELLAKVQEQEHRLATQQSLLEQNEQHKNAYYENNLQTREKAIINELKVAKEEGDIEKEINLSKELAKVTADQSTYGLYKSQLKNQPEYDRHPNIYPQPTYGTELRSPDNNYEEQNYEEPNEAYDLWLEKNSWADPDSRHYSPRLREEANKLANELDEMLRYNGNTDVIGTPDYFKAIDNLMSERYAVQDKEQRPQEPKPRESQYYNVAPVSRNGSSMADQYMSKNPNSTRRSIDLTENEYKIARNLKIRLPNGKFLPEDEAIRRYADAKRLSNPRPNESQKLVIE